MDGRCFDRYSSPLLGDDGKYYGRIWYFRDITENKKAEKKVKEQADAMESAMEGLAILGPDQKYAYVNRAHEKVYGYGPGELLGKSWEVLYYPQELKRFQDKIMPNFFERGSWRGEAIGKKKDGSTFHQEVSLTMLDNGGLICAVHDITERKRTEKNLRESNEIFKSLLEGTPAGVALIIDRKLQKVNRSLCQMTGYAEKELLGKSTQLLYSCEEQFERVGRELYDQMEGEGLGVIETTFRKKSGEILHVLIWLSPFNSGGANKGVMATIVDITERRKIEKKKRILEERLNRAEKMEALGTMAGGVAHDLNNVLGVVIGYAELLGHSIENGNSMKKRLEKILEGGQRAAAIIQDLLTLTRRGIPNRTILNLNKVIGGCNLDEFIRLLPSGPNIKTFIGFEPDILNIGGSEAHLVKTVLNLVSNAVEAMPNGGTLTIKTANRYLDKPVQGYDELREGDYVVLSVSDTGEGIKEEDLKRIFEPFYTKKMMGRSGTGLGLAVVWGTVKDHNGYINVESEVGKGSTFTLYFPVARDELSAEIPIAAIADYMGNGEFILVVDDVPEQRELAVDMLKMLDYNALAVSSGEEAIQYLKKHKADLIVLDMIMDPGMDGLDTYKKILEIHPGQKAIIVSGFSESDRVRQAQDLGVGAYVRKPYVIEKLGVAIKEELQ